MIGASGDGHSADWCISDKDKAYGGAAKVLATTVVDLLWNEAESARKIIDSHQPLMSKQEYLSFLDGLFRTEVFDGGSM